MTLFADKYDPVSVDTAATHKRWMKQPGYAKAYAALADEFAALEELIRGREQAGSGAS